jgi:hypothetical protein
MGQSSTKGVDYPFLGIKTGIRNHTNNDKNVKHTYANLQQFSLPQTRGKGFLKLANRTDHQFLKILLLKKKNRKHWTNISFYFTENLTKF